MTLDEIAVVKHALKNADRYYSESNDKVWNGLVNKGYAVKRGGWEEDMSYFIVTPAGKDVYKKMEKGE